MIQIGIPIYKKPYLAQYLSHTGTDLSAKLPQQKMLLKSTIGHHITGCKCHITRSY